MKPGPIVAMVALVFLGLWMVAQPTLARTQRIDEDARRFELVLGAQDVGVEQRDTSAGLEYHFVGIDRLQSRGWITADDFQQVIQSELAAWNDRPGFERALLGFFNISSWRNFVWVALGLLGQAAFFGRMFVQWIVSERSRESTVPELFWWFSFLGGVLLFTYFVWRVDIVGVLGQSTGVVVYARNLRLIQKQKRRKIRDGEASV